ncbi:MAG: hypothetical protein HYR63_24745 [Proteobacteria bacterium]|nr:hypothetical protein [Pseudomonadota bacterium]
MDAARDLVERAIKRRPSDGRQHHRRADLLVALERPQMATAARRRAARLGPAAESDFAQTVLGFAAAAPAPADAEAHSWCLALAEFVPGLSSQWHFEARRAWALRHADPLTSAARAPDARSGTGEGRLRVGLVSADLGRHPAGYFLAGLLAHRDPTRFQLTCYSDRLEEDALTRRIRAATDFWHDTAELDDSRLAGCIRADAIDVLIDLSGHGFANRLLAFARKPAPIQASWIGAVDTSGMAAMDWLLTDAWEWPPDRRAPASERILRLSAGRLCYAPPDAAPLVSDLPERTPVFGCFAKTARLNAEVIQLWARLLRQVPLARLMLKWSSFDDPGLCAACRHSFRSHGIDADRLILSGWSEHYALLAAYGAIDVALDPFPFSGALTSCEALFMGVPVVTLRGERPAGRQTAAMLGRLGLDDFIADTPEEYRRIACRAILDRQALRRLRGELRPLMLQKLCDGGRAARALEAALAASTVTGERGSFVVRG